VTNVQVNTEQPADAVTGNGRLPNLIIAGVSKAGTTSLFNYLGQHDDIDCSDIKELRYFSPLRHGGSLAPIETYLPHFSSCRGRFAMEATPGYFYGGRAVAAAIDQTCPGVRVVVSLRSPADRCWSWYRFVQSRLRIPKDMSFEEYLDRCEELHRAGTDGLVENQPFWGLGGGCYATWMDAWTEQLGDRFKVVLFDDLEADPGATVTSICAWLDVDVTQVQNFSMAVENKTQPYRSRRLQRAAVSVNQHSEAFFRRHPTAKRRLRLGYYALNKPREHRTMRPATRARLRTFYGPHHALLTQQLSALGLTVPASWE
jgi:hypothetical protein